MSKSEEHQAGYRAIVIENAYKNEIQKFFDVVDNKKVPLYGFAQDLKILELIDTMEAHT